MEKKQITKMAYRLLWADDEIELLKAHIIFLQGKGYEVTTVTNGPDAIEACTKEAFDLVLLDENMPGLTGLETLNRIKEMHPQTPVVMVTSALITYVICALACRLIAFIPKSKYLIG